MRKNVGKAQHKQNCENSSFVKSSLHSPRIGFSVVYEFFFAPFFFFLLFDRGILWHVKWGRKRRKELSLEAAEKRENAQFLHNLISLLLLYCSSTAEWTKINDESTATTRTCENFQLFSFLIKILCTIRMCIGTTSNRDLWGDRLPPLWVRDA